jgi:hypothetical protein
MAKFILDTRLSNAQYVICTEAIRRGIIEPDDLNEGRRTMREQWAFWRNQPPLAAFPSPNAPHIWAGRPDHAIDGNSFNGAIQRLARFYQSLHIPVAFNVPGENWHMKVMSASALRSAARQIRKERDAQTTKMGEREKKVKFFKHQLHFLHDPQTKKPYYHAGQPKPKDGYDTLFNEELKKAVGAFQHDHQLKVDGVIGPQTDRKIDRAYARAKRRRKPAQARAKERAAKVARGEEL